MRKFHKKQLLDIIKNLYILHQKIEEAAAERDYQLVQAVLSTCQEAAIQVGETIEKLEGGGTAAVTCLEQYCEQLYQASMCLEEIAGQNIPAQAVSTREIYGELQDILKKAEAAIQDLPLRREVVFLPYKASMWDSLESVYLAAKDDKDCDAYVVPIPYYDKNADESLGAMHYEGNEYPKNIEITHYTAYNLEERRPDVIYIHNPYDECNVVTCVPERYFSRNLKKLTDCLVYIPYFVLDEMEPDDQVKIDNMKHFCFLPGTVWADKVIVQSEKMRQIYINEYIKAAQARGLSGEYTDRKKLEEKILGLGSPKFDKIQSTDKADLEIPAEWLRIIEKPDGTWKKIILYNTSINALLQNDEKMLMKMESVFHIFREVQDTIALWWRPHPLIPTTVKTMRPELWHMYEEMVKAYQEEGWGIYDDSVDMDRAVVVSDAYYGDLSSLVQVYQATGKPVMIQDADIL